MNTFLQDLQFGLRVLRKSPGFTVIAVMVLTLAIGGVTAMFTIINTMVLRPICAKDPERLVRIYAREARADGHYRGFSFPNYEDLRARNRVFSDVTAFTAAMCGVNEGENTRRTLVLLTSTNYFSTFGVNLAAGRSFLAEEERPGSAIPVVIVSHNYWKRTGSDPALVGKTMHINARAYQIVGVAPENFTGTTAVFAPDLWLPLGMYEAVCNDFMNDSKEKLENRGHSCMMAVAKLKPGITMQAAEQQLKSLAEQLAQAYPDANKDKTMELGPLSRFSMNESRQDDATPLPAALVVLAMSGSVLLISCMNLANMLLARGTARRKEIAVRLALGGSRWRLVRQLLTEGFLLSVIGTLGGLLLGTWASSVMAAVIAPKIGIVNIVFESSPDWRVLLMTCCVCVLSVLVFALGPALRLTRPDVITDLKEQTGDQFSGGAGRSLFAPRNLLVTAQLALSLALLTTAACSATAPSRHLALT